MANKHRYEIGRGTLVIIAAYLALTCTGAAAAQTPPPPAAPPAWKVTEQKQALTGTTTIAAGLEADEPVLDMLGNPEKPLLVLRCQENKLAVYVSWPQVLHVDLHVFGFGEATDTLWRIDDQPIITDDWYLDDSGTAAGQFRTDRATKLLKKIITGKRLALRLRGQSTQDAAFTLGDVTSIATRVAQACGVALQ